MKININKLPIWLRWRNFKLLVQLLCFLCSRVRTQNHLSVEVDGNYSRGQMQLLFGPSRKIPVFEGSFTLPTVNFISDAKLEIKLLLLLKLCIEKEV